MNDRYDLLTQEYIEVISALERKKRVARVKDIAEARGVSSANVSIALSNLAKKELIMHEQYGHVLLTPQGRKLARDLTKRHQAIKSFLVKILGIEADLAESDACQLEHIMSQTSLDALSAFLDFVQHCPKQIPNQAQLFITCGRFNEATNGCNECMVVNQSTL